MKRSSPFFMVAAQGNAAIRNRQDSVISGKKEEKLAESRGGNLKNLFLELYC